MLKLLAVVGLAIAMLTFALTPRARAHDPNTHQADDLSKATSEAFGLCCNGQDWSRVSIWETTTTGYRIMYKGEWLDGPRGVKVKNIPNPDGEAKAWIYYMEGKPYIRCFMPSAQF